MNNLNNESKCFSKGQLIYKNLEKAFNKELEIYIIDVKKDNFIEENMNLQSMITFFIDGAFQLRTTFGITFFYLKMIRYLISI